MQLVGTQRPASEEVLESCGGSLAIETDKGTDEQPEAAGLLRRAVEVTLVGDARLQQEALELADVTARELPVASLGVAAVPSYSHAARRVEAPRSRQRADIQRRRLLPGGESRPR